MVFEIRPMKWLAIISAKLGNSRMNGVAKNFAPMGEMLAVDRVINSVKIAGFYNKVIVLTDNKTYKPTHTNIDIFIEEGDFKDLNHDTKIETAISSYTDNYDFVTHLFGCNVFLLPNWLLAAKTILEKGRIIRNEYSPIDEVESTLTGAKSYNNKPNRYPSYKVHLKNHGIYLDIDYPHELSLAQQIWQNIDAGAIEYNQNIYFLEHEIRKLGIILK